MEERNEKVSTPELGFEVYSCNVYVSRVIVIAGVG
jgi:hypothetical protein